MDTSANDLPCDGCGLQSAPEHLAARVRRLELSTRFRPVHIGVLFVALAPPALPENDFYGLAASQKLIHPLLEALEIRADAEPSAPRPEGETRESARLVEFQRRGCHLAYLSECPLPEHMDPVAATIVRLGSTLVRRIRFNYKPKHVALIGHELAPLIEMLRAGGIGPILTLEQGQPLPALRTGDRESMKLFQRAVAAVAPRDYLSSGYDRIQLTQSDRDLGAGGKS